MNSSASHPSYHIICGTDNSVGATSNHLEVLVARVNLEDLFSHTKCIEPSLPKETS